MSTETFPVELAGRKWEIPPLPFRLIKKIQPAVAKLSRAFPTALEAERALVNLDEAALDAVADVVFQAINHVEPALTKDAFYDLPFATGDLAAALPSVLSACGMRIVTHNEADASEKK